MQSKLSHIVGVVFALLIIFGLVGSLASPQSVLPAAFLVFTVLGWSAAKIVREGVESAKYLYSVIISKAEEAAADADDGDDLP